MYRVVALLVSFALTLWAQLPLQNAIPLKSFEKPIQKAKLSGSKTPAAKVFPKPVSESGYLLAISKKRAKDELTSMLKIGSLLVIGSRGGLMIVDVSDPKHPKELFYSNYPVWRNCKQIAKLDSNKILLWQEEGRVDLGCCGVVLDAEKEVFRIVNITDPRRPIDTMFKDFYLIHEETVNGRLYWRKKKAYPPLEIGKKIGRTVLDDGRFGYHRTLVVKGDDIYLNGTFGIAQFKHSHELLSGEGGSIATDTIRFVDFFKYRDNLEYERLMQDPYFKKYKCTEYNDYGYSGAYMAVGARHIVTPFVILDRDLRKLPHWKRNCNKPTNASPDWCRSVYLAGDTMDEDEWLYLFELQDEKNGMILRTLKIKRDGLIRTVKSFKPLLYKKYMEPFFINLKRIGDYLFLSLNVAKKENGENYKIEMIRIQSDKSLKTQRVIHIGSHKVLDVEYEEPYLYVLNPDAVRIFKLEPKNE
jgi:hypothetical protein